MSEQLENGAPERATERRDIAGVSVEEIAREYGTPTYVYDAAMIEARIESLSRFDVVRFAQKACSNLAILDLCRNKGVLVDAVSAGEIERALAAGYEATGEPHPIVYTADIFDRDALELVVERDIAVNVGSLDMIDQLGEAAPGREITLRFNPGFGHGHSQKTNTGGAQSKHGIWHDQIQECVARAARHDLVIAGVHVHIGSGSDMEHLSQVCNAVERLASEIGSSVHTVSTGGGLPIPYRAGDEPIDIDAYFELWDAARKRLEERFGHGVELEIEPGRYLVAEAGYLVAEIRAIKTMGENLFYLVDAGFNNLARPILYGAYHPMSIAHLTKSEAPRALHDVIVGGPLCESGDIFTQEEGGFVRTQQLPEASVGDYLVIECAGAYGFVMSSNYNSRTMAAEVLVRGSRPYLVRARQSVADMICDEVIPSYD